MKARTEEEIAEAMADLWMVIVTVAAFAVTWYLAGDTFMRIAAERKFIQECVQEHPKKSCENMWVQANVDGR